MRAIVARVKQRFTEWQVAVRDALASTVIDRGDHESVLTKICREHRDRLRTRLQRLARDERALISLAPRPLGDDQVDTGMNGFVETMRRRSIESAGMSLAGSLASRSRWAATAAAASRPRIALSIRSDDAGREVEVRDLDKLDKILQAEFASTIKQRLRNVDIFDYLLYERDVKRLSEKDVADRLISASRLLLAGPADGSARWVYTNPRDPAKDSYAGVLQNQLNELMRGDQVKSAIDLYSDRLSLTLLRDARLGRGPIDGIQECHDDYMQVLRTSPGSGSKENAELERALVYHPFRGEADAWLMERLRVNSRFAGVADSNEEGSIPPRVTRLLDQPEHFQAFVSCLATNTVRHDPATHRWQWHSPDRPTPVDLGVGDIIRAAVTFCLWRREFGDRAIYEIRAPSALNGAKRAAAGRTTPDTGASKAFQEELRCFAEQAALDSFLAKCLHQTGDLAEHQRLTAGLKMAIQFYCDPNNSPSLPDRRI